MGIQNLARRFTYRSCVRAVRADVHRFADRGAAGKRFGEQQEGGLLAVEHMPGGKPGPRLEWCVRTAKGPSQRGALLDAQLAALGAVLFANSYRSCIGSFRTSFCLGAHESCLGLSYSSRRAAPAP